MPEETNATFDATGALWNDNPASIDLLGIGSVVSIIESSLGNELLDPLTVGIHSPWGGGKTTALNLLETSLDTHAEYVVIRTNPWEYDDHNDVRGLLISQVVEALAQKFKDTAGVTDKAKDLLKRISWSRMAALVAKGVITTQWKPEEIVDALTPQPRTKPTSMNGFREAFGEFLTMLPNVERVVVLVDDLDRCLPDAVMATLEAIKLFLSVEKMAFVLAADQHMVRDAISTSLDATGRADRFASNYLDKIVQLPISLPQLNPDQAGSYIALLFAGAAAPSPTEFTQLLEHCKDRRENGLSPVLGDLAGLSWKPEDELLTFAQKIADGLAANTVNNPRYIKRFLNALSVRAQIARENGITIDSAVIAKLFILEDRYGKSFELLVNRSRADRQKLLVDWEKWGRGETETMPDGVMEATREWAGTTPALSTVELDRYFALAASFRNIVLGATLDDNQIELAQNLASSSETIRSTAYDNFKDKPASEQAAIIDALFAMVRGLDDTDNLIKSVVEAAKDTPDLVDQITSGVKDQCWNKLTPLSVAELKLSEVPTLVQLTIEIAADENLDSLVREAAQD